MPNDKSPKKSSTFFINSNVPDPFEEDLITHYEIIEIIQIHNYSKRTSSYQYEVSYRTHKFRASGKNINNITIGDSGLSAKDYIMLLDTKSVDIQKKFDYEPSVIGSNLKSITTAHFLSIETIQDWSNKILSKDDIRKLIRSPY